MINPTQYLAIDSTTRSTIGTVVGKKLWKPWANKSKPPADETSAEKQRQPRRVHRANVSSVCRKRVHWWVPWPDICTCIWAIKEIENIYNAPSPLGASAILSQAQALVSISCDPDAQYLSAKIACVLLGLFWRVAEFPYLKLWNQVR